MILDRLHYLKSESQLESVISRESSFLFNNLILLASCFAVLWGTLFPVISEAVSGEKISLDAGLVQQADDPHRAVPADIDRSGSAVRLAPHVDGEPAPQFPDGRGSLRWCWWLRCSPAGVRSFYALISFGFCLFVALTVLMEFYKGGRAIAAKNKMNLLRATVELTHRNTRRYGGYLVHMGIVLMFIGFTGAAFNQVRREGNERRRHHEDRRTTI